ncbi:hypothetical protein [Geodermatophilus ruber]|uniref:Uncharacterized protein n=1 Tax=Geodermatophilus ruber TaxID=504800 RepID=A0A1I4FKL3_9ACTN|nr:hypothetical protein [Geodermatophilus ruber]SFL18485.1 hypothetical protein SAMN04488085_107224 [Geodermatophilus ruber]
MTLQADAPVAVPDADPEAAQAAIEHCYAQDWSDGLPLVPATRTLVDRFLATVDRQPDEVIGTLPHLNRSVTLELAAINAAMAGCRPEYFPVVLAAWEAIQRDRSATGGGWQSTSGPSPLLVVNGPVRRELGFNAAGGAFGPGFRPNMTIARAIGLMVRNALGVVPHGFEQATQGLPGRWQVCLAENEEESPWEPLAVEGGVPAGTSAVSGMLTRTVEYVDNRHTADPEQLLADFADTISRSGAAIFRHHPAGIVFCPEHAQLLAGAGMSKADVRAWLVERCGRSKADLARVGKDGVGDNGVRFADGGTDPGAFDRLFATDGPEALPILVAGARNAGISMVVRVFSGWSASSVPVVGRTTPSTPVGAAQ